MPTPEPSPAPSLEAFLASLGHSSCPEAARAADLAEALDTARRMEHEDQARLTALRAALRRIAGRDEPWR